MSVPLVPDDNFGVNFHLLCTKNNVKFVAVSGVREAKLLEGPKWVIYLQPATGIVIGNHGH